MPDLDLDPGSYREKASVLYRVAHASRRQKLAALVLGVWAASVWFHRFAFDFMPHPLITAAIAFGPGLAWYLWLAFTDP